MEDFGKREITKLLTELDSRLSESLELIIGGGAAGIIAYGYQRSTMDIDVLNSMPGLSQIKIQIKAVAEKYGLNENWINDSSKGFIDLLPPDYLERLQTMPGDFKHLTVKVISQIDLFIMKLAAFRPEDIKDIEMFEIKPFQMQIIKKTIKRISTFNEKKALHMKLFLEEAGLWKQTAY